MFRTVFQRSWPLFVIVLVWGLFHSQVLTGHQVLFMRDLTFYALPVKHFWLAEVLAGRLPLWTPYLSSGMPFLADPSHQVLYPFNVIFLLPLPLPVTLSLFQIIHQLFAGLAAYGLARTVLGFAEQKETTLSKQSARCIGLATGLTWMLSGYVTCITDNIHYLPGCAWLPLTVACLLRAFKVSSQRFLLWAAVAAVSTALMLLAGDALSPLAAGLFFVVFGLASLQHQSIRRLLLTGGIWALGTVGLAAGQILPTLELVYWSVRRLALTPGEAFAWSTPPQRLIEFLVPYFFGSKYPVHQYIGQAFYPLFHEPWVNSIYWGVLPVLSACLAAWKRVGPARLWFGLAVFCMLLALGNNLLGYELLYKTIPTLSSHRYMEKWLMPASLFGLTAAVLGAQYLWLRLKQGTPFFRVWPFPMIAWPVRLLSQIAILSLLLVTVVQLPAELWIWPHAHERSSEWQGTNYPRQAHVERLSRHFLLLMSLLFAATWVPRSKQRFVLLSLLLVSVVDVAWLNRYNVPLLETELAVREGRPFGAQVLALEKDQVQQPLKVYYDDSVKPAENLRDDSVWDRIAKARGLSEPIDIRQHYWAYRLLYNQERLLYNTAVRYGIAYQNGRFTPLQPLAHQQMDRALTRYNLHTLLRHCGVTHVMTTLRPEHPIYEEATHYKLVDKSPTYNLRTFRVLNTKPRAWLAPNAVFNDDPMQYRFISSQLVAPDLTAEIHRPSRLNRIERAHEMVTHSLKAPLTIERDVPGEIRISITNPYEQTAWLVTTEGYFPGWSALIDGRPVSVEKANHRFISTSVPPGDHKIVLQYHSSRFQWGLALSCLTLLALAVLAARGFKTVERPNAHMIG